jgi:hypothetical protein
MTGREIKKAIMIYKRFMAEGYLNLRKKRVREGLKGLRGLRGLISSKGLPAVAKRRRVCLTENSEEH